jgi:hypothetical protein
MTLTIILSLLHVLAAFILITGILGRSLAMREAARASASTSWSARTPRGALRDDGPRLVHCGALFGLLSAWRTGWPILGFLQGGSANLDPGRRLESLQGRLAEDMLGASRIGESHLGLLPL